MQETWTSITDMSIEDGYSWQKYGQKEILNAKTLRCYFRCSYKFNKVIDDYTTEEGFVLLNFESNTLTKQDPPFFSSLPPIKQAKYNPSSSEYLSPQDLTKFKSSIAKTVSPLALQYGHEYDVSRYTTSSSSNFDMDLELIDYVYLNDEELPKT
ncbi:hypothetical protein NE237_009317 [Protea cynaroides]|uniref:WRKY domain-containing protein n=1 Tax=Protea cynaroides TaxID=273540 RepID=A0A9Q0R0I4_9MAGN|nr:hypothetical protein NE237_009317 [Protea cynaroides]